MALMYPPEIAKDTRSNAERKLYDLFQKRLSNDYVVIHSVNWITRDPRRYGPVGEADFVIAHPIHGVLIIEVKGGGIHLDRGKWYTTNATGEKHAIKDPAVQASKSVYALKGHLEQNELTRNFSFRVFHAVAFPDVDVHPNKSLRPDIPRIIIIDRSCLVNLEQTIEEIFEFWLDRFRRTVPPGKNAIDALVQLMAPKREIKTKIAHIFEEENQQIKKLTQDQYDILRVMQRFRRAAIIGGAGTGKTMLAVEKARQLSQSGFKVLLLTYNSNLARWLAQITSDFDQIFVNTFHELVRTAVDKWAEMPPLTQQSEYFDKAEDLLFDALEVVKNDPIKAEQYLFDAVIIDEGQDFKSDYWIPISDLLKDPATGVLYVFFDDNQRVYEQLSHIPISNEQQPFVLERNRRNTKSIFTLLQEYAQTSNMTHCEGPEGRSVEFIPAEHDTDAQKALRSTLHDWVVEQGAQPSQIVVLTPRSADKSIWTDGLKLGNYSLKWDTFASNNHDIRVSTIQAFKGLESPIVILTEMEHSSDETREQLAYVGISRARNQLIVIGNMPTSKEKES